MLVRATAVEDFVLRIKYTLLRNRRKLGVFAKPYKLLVFRVNEFEVTYV